MIYTFIQYFKLSICEDLKTNRGVPPLPISRKGSGSTTTKTRQLETEHESGIKQSYCSAFWKTYYHAT